jgi:hypothetical protein
MGRPRISVVIRELVVQIAKDTGWGYSRILGELKKLHVGRISRQSVKNILVGGTLKRDTARWRAALPICGIMACRLKIPMGVVVLRLHEFLSTHRAIQTIVFIGTLSNPLAKTIEELHDDLRTAGTGRISLPKLSCRGC